MHGENRLYGSQAAVLGQPPLARNGSTAPPPIFSRRRVEFPFVIRCEGKRQAGQGLPRLK